QKATLTFFSSAHAAHSAWCSAELSNLYASPVVLFFPPLSLAMLVWKTIDAPPAPANFHAFSGVNGVQPVASGSFQSYHSHGHPPGNRSSLAPICENAFVASGESQVSFHSAQRLVPWKFSETVKSTFVSSTLMLIPSPSALQTVEPSRTIVISGSRTLHMGVSPDLVLSHTPRVFRFRG